MSEKTDMEKRKELFLNRYSRSEKWRRAWEPKWLRWYKILRGAVPVLPKDDSDRSNLHIPYTYSTLDTVRSRLMAAVFANRPYIAYVPRGENDVNNAKNMETLVDLQLEKCEVYLKMYNLITDVLLYGGCPYETGWRLETKLVNKRIPIVQTDVPMGYEVVQEEITLWDDPDFNPFDIFDFYPDPDGVDVDSSVFVIRKRFVTEKEIRRQEKLGFYKIKEFDELRAGWDKVSEGRSDKLAAIGAAVSESDVSDDGSRRFEVLEMAEDDKITTLINRTEVVQDAENRFWHGKKPFGFAKIDPLSGEFYGIGLVEVIEYLQAELNTTRNQRIDNASIGLNRMWMVAKSAGIDPKDLVSRPNGIIWLKNFDDLKEVTFTPLDASAYTEESIIKGDIQEATATYNEARGAQSGDKRTATENAIREKSVNIRFEGKAKLFELLALRRLAMFFDQMNQQFFDTKRKLRVEADTGYQWVEMGPEDIAGSYDYMPSGSALEPTLDSLNYRNNLLALYDKFAQDPEIKARELKKRIFQSFNMKDVESLLKTEQEIAMEQFNAALMQEKARQAALMGGGNAGQNAPAANEGGVIG